MGSLVGLASPVALRPATGGLPGDGGVSLSQGGLNRSSSLVVNSQNSTGSGWDAKQRRAYSALLSGLKRYHYGSAHPFLCHITLTSKHTRGAKCTKDDLILLSRDFNRFMMRFKRTWGKLDYFKVMTTEGGGVIHLVLRCDAFWRYRYDFIRNWIVCHWHDCHKGSWLIYFKKCFNSKKLARYVVSQYVGFQTKFYRSAHSVNWCFRGFRRKFLSFLKELGFKDGLAYWDHYLAFRIDHPTYKQQTL